MAYMVIITLIIFLVFFSCLFRNKNGLPTNWPFVGMIPALFKNTHRINEFMIELMEKSNLNFEGKGPWFSNMNLLVTVDPTNIHHVFNKNFGNYVKGEKLHEILLELFRDGIFNTDSTPWRYHRNVAQSFFNQPKFYQSLVDVTWKKVQGGLIPVLNRFTKDAVEIDLQNVFVRFMYDTMCSIMLEYDPRSLSFDLPSFPILQAVCTVQHVIVSRHMVPTCIWKFLRWLNVGEEKKLNQACKILDDFINNI